MMLYRLKYAPMEKTAGTPIPSNPKQWSAEITKALVNQHSYVDTRSSRIKFDKTDPDERTASGVIILDKKAAVPFTIRPNENTSKIELDPLDVIFSNGKFNHLNEFSYRQAVDGAPSIQQFPKGKGEYSKAPAGNEYTGDLTGDITPLEFSGYPNAMSGPRAMTMASCGLLSRVVRNDNDMAALGTILTNYSGIDGAAEALGLKDSLFNLRTGTKDPDLRSQAVQVLRRDDGQLVVSFDDGETRAISAIELKEILGNDAVQVMRELMNRGWSIIRDFPTVRSCEAPIINTLPSVIEQGGYHRLITTDGCAVNGIVATKMLTFDGQIESRQKVVLEGGGFDIGQGFIGTRIPEPLHGHPGGTSVLDAHGSGCFMDESFGSVMFTPSVRIHQVVELPGHPPMMIVDSLDTMERIGLVLAPHLVRPQPISKRHMSEYPMLPPKSYYLPSNLIWVETTHRVELADKTKRNSIKDPRPMVTLSKNAGRYELHGKTHTGDVHLRNMDEDEMRMKLASYGADDYAIEKACSLKSGQMSLWGLRKLGALSFTKKASISVNPRHIEKIRGAAGELLKSANEVLQTQNNEEMQDPKVMDAILSLQFVSEETLGEIVESLPLFEDVEDKLAKMVMAARHGERAIHEKGVSRALKGMGEAKTSIKTLAIELESREQ
jgi:hypothetical protein